MINPIVQVLNSAPINYQAALVASQKNCAKSDLPLSREELIALNERLLRKHRLMKHMLGIVTPKQHENLMARLRNGQRRHKNRPLRLVREYAKVGQTIAQISLRLNEIKEMGKIPKKVRQQIGSVEQVWRDAHPGCIWDGRQLVAPNGETFSRAILAMEVV